MAQHQAGEGMSNSQDRLFQSLLGRRALPLGVDAAGLVRRALNRYAWTRGVCASASIRGFRSPPTATPSRARRRR